MFEILASEYIPMMLQFHLLTEATKFGLNLEEADEMLTSEAFKVFKNMLVVGVMGMTIFTDN